MTITATPSTTFINNLCPQGPQHHGMQLNQKQVINHTQAAYKLRITHNLEICVIEDQLSGRVPDKPLELTSLTSRALSN